MKILNDFIKYRNGNYDVTIFKDGTKTREYTENPKPAFPESVDLKITDYCDAGCPKCHERSTTYGLHAKFNHVKHVINGLHQGVELAIGGGNPLSYGGIKSLLFKSHEMGLVSNLTVHASHLNQYKEQIQFFRSAKYIYGLGISYDDEFSKTIKKFCDENTVIHLIVGIHSPEDAVEALKLNKKILILGYKIYGRGAKYDQKKLEESIKKWRFWIGTLCRTKDSVISFDNLAIKQLDLRRILSEDIWNKFYMGDDGKFTMYVDAVKMEYAASSTSQRFPLNGMRIVDAFKEIQKTVSMTVLNG